MLEAALLTSAVICSFTGVQSFFLWNSRTDRHLIPFFCAMSIFAAVYLVATNAYYAADSTAAAGLALRVQTAAAMLFVMAFVGVCCALIGWKSTRWATFVFAAFSISIALITLNMESSIRYSDLSTVTTIELPWGEIISRYSGTNTPWLWLFHIAARASFLWGIFSSVILFKQRKYTFAVLLSLYSGALFFTHYIGSSIDVGAIQFIYVTWIPVVLLVTLGSFLIARRQSFLYETLHEEIDRRRSTEKMLAESRLTDDLTGLPNHQHFIEYLEQSLRSNQRPSYLILIGVKDFKSVNTIYGDENGDRILMGIVERLSSSVLQDLFIARAGGDRFVVVLGPQSLNGTRAQRQFDEQEWDDLTGLNQPFLIGHHPVYLRFSIGVVQLHDKIENAQQAMWMAIMAKTEAKRLGKTVFYDERLTKDRDYQRHVQIEFVKALKCCELEVHWQPQVSFEGSLIGAELLSRWTHPQLGSVPPDVFIPIAEQHGLVSELCWYQLETACVQWKEHLDGHVPDDFRIAINISVQQLNEPKFAIDFLATLHTYGTEPKLFEIEITESMFIGNRDTAEEHITILRLAGVKVAIDDFGTGYSSLAYLATLSVDLIKIDRSFVDAIGTSRGREVVRVISSLTKTMGIDVLAEGVESRQQQEILKDLGCTLYQGWLFGKPMPVEIFRAWLTGSNNVVEKISRERPSDKL